MCFVVQVRFSFCFLGLFFFTTLVTNSGFSDRTCSNKLCNEINQWNSPDNMGEVDNTWFTVVFSWPSLESVRF